jgi:hypothetical protein
VYLNDNEAFIEKPKGKSSYVCTLKYLGSEYGVREYPDDGVIYCDTNPDTSFPTRLAVTTDDHQINYVMLKANSFLLESLRYYFEHGCFRFKDLSSKQAVMSALSY